MKKKGTPGKSPSGNPAGFPSHINLKDALKGLPMGDEIMLAYYLDDVEVQRDFYIEGGRKIPRLLLHIKKRATIEIYGSHLETPEERQRTHVVHNPTNYYLMFVPQFGRPWPPYIFMIQNSRNGWVVAYDAASRLKGEALKTVFQGVATDPDLERVLSAVEEIKNIPVDYMGGYHFPGGTKTERRVGERLLDFLVPVIRTSNFKKVRLLEKCMKYLETPTKTKLDRFVTPLRGACEKLGRLPTPPELLSCIRATGFQIADSRFYTDLNDIGLGWLTRDHSTKTPVGGRTK
jgi:hypothetical protein